MRISLLVPIIDPSIVNKFTDIPLWYICNYFSLRILRWMLMSVSYNRMVAFMVIIGMAITLKIPTGRSSPHFSNEYGAYIVISDGYVDLYSWSATYSYGALRLSTMLIIMRIL